MNLDRTGYDDGWGYSSDIDAWIHEESGFYYRRPSGMTATAEGLALTRGKQEATGKIALDDERGRILISSDGLPDPIDDASLNASQCELHVVSDVSNDPWRNKLDELRWQKTKCLDDGFVCLVDAMGQDDSVVQAARVSYGRDVRDYESIPDEAKQALLTEFQLTEVRIHESDKRDMLTRYHELQRADTRKLLRFMMRHHHTSPFEMVEVKLLVRCPMDVWRQWIRHRTANVNEYSTRYTTAIDSAMKTKPEEWRLQSKSNKQGSSGLLHDQGRISIQSRRCPDEVNSLDCAEAAAWCSQTEEEIQRRSREVYETRLRYGIASEQARKDLPLSTYTEAYWKIDLHNLMHFLGKRLDTAAQLEIRTYANAIAEIVKQLWPLCWEAFVDYRLEAMTLSRMEVEMLRDCFAALRRGESVDGPHPSMDPKREYDEFKKKLQRLVG